MLKDLVSVLYLFINQLFLSRFSQNLYPSCSEKFHWTLKKPHFNSSTNNGFWSMRTVKCSKEMLTINFPIKNFSSNPCTFCTENSTFCLFQKLFNSTVIQKKVNKRNQILFFEEALQKPYRSWSLAWQRKQIYLSDIGNYS